jgi:hypothetical protein
MALYAHSPPHPGWLSAPRRPRENIIYLRQNSDHFSLLFFLRKKVVKKEIVRSSINSWVSFSVFEIEPLSSSLRLGNMVGGLGWVRRRVCTCRLGSPIHQTDKTWIDFWHFRDFASPTMAHPRCREL